MPRVETEKHRGLSMFVLHVKSHREAMFYRLNGDFLDLARMSIARGKRKNVFTSRSFCSNIYLLK